MTPQEFVSCIRHEVLEQNLTLFRHNLQRSVLTSTGGDTYWPRTAELYQSLTDEQRQQFMKGIRQVMVDTLSTVLGILDGSTVLEQHRDHFHLTYGDDPQELNGELQDWLLSPET